MLSPFFNSVVAKVASLGPFLAEFKWSKEKSFKNFRKKKFVFFSFRNQKKKNKKIFWKILKKKKLAKNSKNPLSRILPSKSLFGALKSRKKMVQSWNFGEVNIDIFCLQRVQNQKKQLFYPTWISKTNKKPQNQRLVNALSCFHQFTSPTPETPKPGTLKKPVQKTDPLEKKANPIKA